MTERDKAEKNRRLAEWLSPKPANHPRVLGRNVAGWIFSDEMEDRGISGEMQMIGWQPCDFYSSEEASALLLEKMMQANCRLLADRGGVTIYGPPKKRLMETEILFDARGRRFDRELNRTAIAEAALRLMESEKK